MPSLEIRNLTKRYRGLAVVDDVSFEIHSGEVTGYLGPNGSGKSTTVKMLTGLVDPSAGQILYDGVNIRRDIVLFKRQVGYVPEEADVYPALTAMEYLALVGRLRGLSERAVREKSGALLELFGLHLRRHSPLGSYSKGMKQRVLISAALMHDPRVLILDEPLSGLDVSSALLFHHLLDELAARGKTVLYISHILEVVEKVCSRVVILYKGKVAAQGRVDELRELTKLPSLASIFAQLVHEDDSARVARDIAGVVGA
jgi:ABC-2 type transport system ATP-binding protein